jgi:hypothetical protein
LKAQNKREKSFKRQLRSRAKIVVDKAHHSGQDAGDLTIVKSHARSNAVYGNF